MKEMTDTERALVLARAKFERARMVLIILVVSATLAFSAGMLFMMYSTYQTQKSIKDCTTPQGRCAKRGQAQTAKAINIILSENKNISKEGSAPAREALLILQIQFPDAAIKARQEMERNR